MRYAQNRKQRRASGKAIGHLQFGQRSEDGQHRQHQQGDEIACSCGRRWPVGENHP